MNIETDIDIDPDPDIQIDPDPDYLKSPCPLDRDRIGPLISFYDDSETGRTEF